MPSIVRIFNGKMDKDSHPYRVKPEDYIDALNITKDSEGEGSDGPPSNIPGNLLVSYAGITGPLFKTIGQFPDKIRNRIYYFVWGSNGHNQILFYDKSSNAIIKVLEDLTDTNNVGILNFNPSWHINHIDIVYRDNGDLIFWTDGLNSPSKINVQTALNGGYGVVQRSFIDVAKEPPSIPPPVTYEDDSTVSVNNLRKRLWKFKYRFVFDDLEKSVWSAQSEIPLPVNYTDSAVDTDPTKNARIAMAVQTGKSNVKKIEIAAAQSLGNVFSDFFLVTVIDKAVSSVPDNDVTIFKFYNNQAYNNVDVIESVLDADWVPQKAYTQSLPNGNVLTYGAITEGYELNIAILGFSAAITLVPEQTTQYPFIFIANQSGDSGFGSGNIHVIVIGVIPAGSVFNIYTTNQTVSFTGSTTSAGMIAGLAAAATTSGFTVVSSDSENLIIVKTGESLQRILPTNVLIAPSDSFIYDWFSRYTFGILYRDEKGRQVGGVATNVNMSVQTPSYAEFSGVPQITEVVIFVAHRPPVEARYFNLVRTLNLTKSNWIDWVSDRTFKDDKFAYISIANLTQFIIDNPTTILSYNFTPGDRIRFIKSLSNGANSIYDKDFDIISQPIDPVINGVTETGKFIKISLPATSPVFDFGVQGGVSFNNYLIQLYTPAQSVANGLDVYYEFGERYDIGDPGLPTRYHQGMASNQTPNLSQQAVFALIKGDAYFRHRTINVGVEIVYAVTSGGGANVNAGRVTLGLTPTLVSFNDPNVVVGTSPYADLVGWDFTNPSRLILKVISGVDFFRIKGTLTITFDADRSGDVYQFLLQRNDGAVFALTPQFDNSKAGTYTFQVDTPFNLGPGQFVSILGFSVPDFSHTRSMSATDLTITRDLSFNVAVTDPNFSDFFNSRVTSNGRPSVVDPNAAKTYFPTKVRFGGEYQQDTNINQLNRFFFDNQDTYDRSFGDIRKFFIEGRFLWVFQKFETGIVPVLTQIVKDVSGNPLEANSDQLLNKITYPFKGKYGIGDCPESFAYGKFAKYFFDNYKGVVVRISQDGPIALSVLYKMNSFFVPKGPNFRTDLNNGLVPAGQTYMGNPAVYGVFDSFTNKYIIALEEINRYTNGGATLSFHQDPFTVAFLESRDASEGFESLYSYHPEMMASLDNLLVTWKAGKLWTHNNSVNCSFYGNQDLYSITGSFNDHMRQKKTWESLSEDASVVWECVSILTQLKYGNQFQSGSILADEFKSLEGEFDAPFKRDAGSAGGKIQGAVLKGKYIIIKLQSISTTAGDFAYLNAVSVQYIDSPLTK